METGRKKRYANRWCGTTERTTTSGEIDAPAGRNGIAGGEARRVVAGAGATHRASIAVRAGDSAIDDGQGKATNQPPDLLKNGLQALLAAFVLNETEIKLAPSGVNHKRPVLMLFVFSSPARTRTADLVVNSRI